MARPKHRTKPGATYFVTTDTWQRRALFRNPTAAAILEEKIFENRDTGFYLVHSYVVMPEHLHIILTPGDATTLEKAVQLIKGGSAYRFEKSFNCDFQFGTRDSPSIRSEIKRTTRFMYAT
jgi:putative transposase